MFNILVDLLPTTVTVGGVEYPINTDFRTSILFEQMAADPDIESEDKWRYLLEYYYQGIVVTGENVKEFVEQALKFYSCNKQLSSKENEGDLQENEGSYQSDKIYDFDFDDTYIYTAFLQQYGIDLQEIEYLHWWKFKAMFDSLQDSKFCKILEYRSVDLAKVNDEEQRKHYKAMKELYKLPTKKNIAEEKKQQEITECLRAGLDPSHLL